MKLKSLLFGTAETGRVKYGIAADTQDRLPLKEIRNGIVQLKDGRFIKLLEIIPVNYYLKSYREQEQIAQSFAAYLKIAPDNLQIRVLCQKADLETAMNRLWERYDAEEEPACRDMIEKGVYLLGTLAQNQTLRRRFFLVFQHGGRDWASAGAALEKVALEAAGMLEECGLESSLLEDEDTFGVFEQIINKHAGQFLHLDDTRDNRAESLAPWQMDMTNHRYIIIDGVYHATLYVASYGYPTQVYAGWLGFLAEAGEGIGLSFFLNRQRKDKVLSQIAQKTMWSRSRMRDVGDTRQDYEQLESAIFAGLYLKEGINRASQDFYYMNTLIEVSADSPEVLEQRIESVKNLCTANNYTVKRTDYCHEQGFLSCLPTLSPDATLMRKSRRNILTDSAAASFPFCSFELYDPEGILLGQNMVNSSVAMLDIFDSSKYSNANMCIMGTSGAGKTYLLQLLALRHRCQGTQVFIIAPLKGHEFRPACEAIGGRYIKLSPASQECINIMDQRDAGPNVRRGRGRGDDSILADKLQKLHIFFTLIKPNITYEERHFLDNALTETYARFGITHENDSLYDDTGALKPMPCLADLHGILSQSPETKLLSQVLSRFVTGSAKRLGGHTNVDLKNKYIVLDISEMSAELLPMGMFLALDFVWDEVKRNHAAKKVVILDELWNLIGGSSNSLAAQYVVEIFKTIRGLGGAAIGATQDLNDFFTLDNGDYGKGILGNARIKIVMQMEEDEAERVRKVLSLSDEEMAQIIRCKKGQGLLCTGFIRTGISFAGSMDEYELISTAREAIAARDG